MSVHSLRIHARAEALADRLSVIIELWAPIHRDGLGRTIVESAEDIAAQIKKSYEARITDEKLHRLVLADECIQEAKHGIYRSINRALLDEHEGTMLTRSFRGLSISTIEFANAILERDPEYRGQWRPWVERRRVWKLRAMADVVDNVADDIVNMGVNPEFEPRSCTVNGLMEWFDDAEEDENDMTAEGAKPGSTSDTSSDTSSDTTSDTASDTASGSLSDAEKT
jgi:hypothetical protein